MLLNVPDKKDVCRQLLVFRAINRALITLANEGSEQWKQISNYWGIYFLSNKLPSDPNNHFNVLPEHTCHITVAYVANKDIQIHGTT